MTESGHSAAVAGAPPLDLRTKLAFGIGQIAEGIQVAVFLLFLLFYYNQVLGVPGTLCGLAIGLSLVFDAVTDPLLGSISDAWRSRLGRRLPFMYAAAVPLGVGFYLLFNPLVSGNGPLFAWLLGMTVLCRAAMTLYHVPHSALGAELTNDYDERTTLVAVRHFFGATAFILVFGLGFFGYFAPTDEYPKGQLNPAAYGPFSGWLALTMTVTIVLSAWGTQPRVPYLPTAREDQSFSLTRMFADIGAAMRIPPFRWLVLGFVVIIVAFGTASALNLYMLTFFWALSNTGTVIVLLATPIGSMIGYVIAGRLFRTLDKKTAVLLGVALWFVGHAAGVPLLLAGWLPPPGSTGLLVAVTLLTLLGTFGIAQVLVGTGTMMADITDQHELASGQRQEGVFFGALSLTNKSSAALGSLIGGTALDLIAWPTGPQIQTAADVPWDTIVTLGLVWGPLAVMLALPGLWLFNRYSLSREEHREILRQLDARRVAGNGSATLDRPLDAL